MAQNNLTEAELRAKFDEIDADKNGSLSREELEAFCEKLDKKPTQSDILKIFRHMDIDSDGKVTFEEFYEWWTNKENNLLPLLYAKQAIKKSFSKATNEVNQILKDVKINPLHAEALADFKASFQVGDAAKNVELEFKVATSLQSELNSKPYRDACGIAPNAPAVVLKFKVEKEKQAEAKAILADLVEQGKEIIECILPPEISQQYLSMVDIKVEAFGTEHLIISLSSTHPLIEGIRQSYEALLSQFRVTDQSIVVDLKLGSSLDLKAGIEKSSIQELASSAVKGVEFTVEIQAAKTVLTHVKELVYDQLKQSMNGYASRKRKQERLFTIFLSLLHGVNLKVETEDLSDLIPAKKLEAFSLDELVSKFKKDIKPEQLIGSMPIFSDVIEFLTNHTLPSFSVLALAPGIYVEVSTKVENLSSLWNKLIG